MGGRVCVWQWVERWHPIMEQLVTDKSMASIGIFRRKHSNSKEKCHEFAKETTSRLGRVLHVLFLLFPVAESRIFLRGCLEAF